MSRQSALWILAGVLGIVLAAGITWATSQLTSQHIGLSSEPISAARALAPRSPERATPVPTHTTTTSRVHARRRPAAPQQATSGAPEARSTVGATSPPAPIEQAPSAAGESSTVPETARPSGGAHTPAGEGAGDDGTERRSAHGRDD